MTFQWKISFNPDPSKQAQKIIFSKKTKKIFYTSLRFNNTIYSQTSYQKHLGIFLDSRLTLEEHLKVISTKVDDIGLLQKLQNILEDWYWWLYTKLVRLHRDYGEAIHEESYNEIFHQKFESIQYMSDYPYQELLNDSREKNLSKN